VGDVAGWPDVWFDGIEPGTLVLLVLAALVAGWVDAVVGGGALVQIPALLVLVPGATPVQVLATNKISSVGGTLTSSVTYLRRVRPPLRTVLPMAALAFAGAAAGALCAGLLSPAVFRPLVLAGVVAVAVYVLRRPDLGDVTALRLSPRRHLVAAAAIGVGLGFYDGIFGPGTGSFLVFALVGVLGYAFLEASAQARIVNLATNLGAIAVFAPQGAPLWGPGLCMGAAAVLGGYVGARTAIARGSRFVRVVFLVVVGALSLRRGYDVVAG
jgi:uncharacterized membrane protein YfcA